MYAKNTEIHNPASSHDMHKRQAAETTQNPQRNGRKNCGKGKGGKRGPKSWRNKNNNVTTTESLVEWVDGPANSQLDKNGKMNTQSGSNQKQSGQNSNKPASQKGKRSADENLFRQKRQTIVTSSPTTTQNPQRNKNGKKKCSKGKGGKKGPKGWRNKNNVTTTESLAEWVDGPANSQLGKNGKLNTPSGSIPNQFGQNSYKPGARGKRSIDENLLRQNT